MNPSNHRRFFAFGCSFTNYYWPTWATIIGRDVSEYYNYGQMAAGNTFIFHQLVEAHVRHKFGPGDLVMVMWSIPLREDRYVDRWHLLKSLPTAHGSRGLADPEYYRRYCSEYGSLLRDLTTITSSLGMLQSTGCEYHFMSMQPFTYLNHSGANREYNFLDSPDDNINTLTEFFKDTLNQIKPSIYQLIFNYKWQSQVRVVKPDGSAVYTDWHPLPDQHLAYLDQVFPANGISEQARAYTHEYTQRILDHQPYRHSLTASEYVQLYDLKGQLISWPDGS